MGHKVCIWGGVVGTGASLGAHTVKNLHAMQETQVQSPSWLGKRIATHSRICAWEIPWTEEFDRPQSTGSQRVRLTHTCTHTWGTEKPTGDVIPPGPYLAATLGSSVHTTPTGDSYFYQSSETSITCHGSVSISMLPFCGGNVSSFSF